MNGKKCSNTGARHLKNVQQYGCLSPQKGGFLSRGDVCTVSYFKFDKYLCGVRLSLYSLTKRKHCDEKNSIE
jgi:hypothetical protein